MISKEEKNKRKKLVKAIEDKQHAEEISKMPISKADLKALIEFLGNHDFICDHSFKETIAFLEKRGLDKNKIIPWLNEYGGNCDCEVVFNVEDAWGEYVGVNWGNDDFQEIAPKKKEQKQEILSLTCGLKLENIPKEWKLFFVDTAKSSYWCMKFGKKGNLCLNIVEKPLPKGDLESDEYWSQQWSKLSNLRLYKPCVVEKGQEVLSNVTLKSVTVINPDCTLVYRWIYKEDNGNWYMQAETSIERKQNDFRELSNLLGKMELT